MNVSSRKLKRKLGLGWAWDPFFDAIEAEAARDAEVGALVEALQRCRDALAYPPNGWHVCRWCHEIDGHSLDCQWVALTGAIDGARSVADRLLADLSTAAKEYTARIKREAASALCAELDSGGDVQLPAHDARITREAVEKATSPHCRLVRFSEDVFDLPAFALRDNTGRAIAWDWGEPDDFGVYQPTLTSTEDGWLDAQRREAVEKERERLRGQVGDIPVFNQSGESRTAYEHEADVLALLTPSEEAPRVHPRLQHSLDTMHAQPKRRLTPSESEPKEEMT